MPRCIYCLLELPEDQFNTEHIVPRQLGSFRETVRNDRLTLHLTVCADCNSYFGKTIELAFGRDSIEAVYRLKYGQKRPREFQGFNSERVVFRVPDYMPDGGVVLTPAASPDGKEIVMMLPPQVGVLLPGENLYRYYTADDLAGDGGDGLPTPDQSVKLRLLAADDAGVQQVRSLVLMRFPKFREEGKLGLPPPERIDGKMLVEIKFKVDRLLARAVAKIAFNYMAFHAGSNFALNTSFDPIRRFIRYGEGGENWRRFVQFLSEPLLAQETEELCVTRGHILIAGWKDFQTLTVRVSPYNSMAYEVTLTSCFSGVSLWIKVGHVFDWEDHKIIPHTSVDRIVLPPGWAQRPARAYQTMVQRPPT